MVHTKFAESHKNIGQSVAPTFLLDPLRIDIFNIDWVQVASIGHSRAFYVVFVPLDYVFFLNTLNRRNWKLCGEDITLKSTGCWRNLNSPYSLTLWFVICLRLTITRYVYDVSAVQLEMERKLGHQIKIMQKCILQYNYLSSWKELGVTQREILPQSQINFSF